MPSPTVAGNSLSFAQLEAVWIQAGGDPSLAPTMAAIGKAESGGRPNATNPTDNNGKQTSWGIWQVSQGNHNPYPNWNDPVSNAKIAISKLNSQGLSAWGTYTSGAYKKFMPAGTVTPASFSATPVSDVTNEANTTTKSCYWQIKLSYGVGSTTICMDDLLWAGMIALGSSAVLAGAAFIVIGLGSESKTLRSVVNTTTQMLPELKIAKAVKRTVKK